MVAVNERRRTRGGSCVGLSHLAERWRFLWLALKLLWAAGRSARRAGAPGSAIAPDCALSSHGAPLAANFPKPIAAAPLPASTLRDPLNGYKVVFVPFNNGQPNGMAHDVVTGLFYSENQARGRPMGLAIDKSGALLIANVVDNTVLRVTSAGRG